MINQSLLSKQGFTTHEMQLLQSEMSKREKSTTPAWLLWVFLGTVGGHRFYLEQTGSAITMAVIWLFSWLTLVIGIGFIGFLALGIWWFIDAFQIQGMINAKNEEIESKIILDIQQMRQAQENTEAQEG